MLIKKLYIFHGEVLIQIFNQIFKFIVCVQVHVPMDIVGRIKVHGQCPLLLVNLVFETRFLTKELTNWLDWLASLSPGPSCVFQSALVVQVNASMPGFPHRCSAFKLGFSG